MVKQIKDKAEFDKCISENSYVVVDFTASWCGPCKMISPKFDEFSKLPEFERVTFIKVDVDEVQEVSEACGISCMPTFQFYKDGKKVNEFSGADATKLKEKISELLTQQVKN